MVRHNGRRGCTSIRDSQCYRIPVAATMVHEESWNQIADGHSPRWIKDTGFLGPNCTPVVYYRLKFFECGLLVNINYLSRRAIRSLGRRVINSSFRLIAPLDCFLVRNARASGYRPTFVVGPARSGTTLIYQALTSAIQCCYFSNLMSKYSFCPGALTQILWRAGLFDANPSYSSHYGKTAGWNGVSQGSQIWSRWFPRSSDSVSKVNTQVRLDCLIELVEFLQKTSSRPFVNKWPGLAVYIPSLISAFPDALYLRVTRDPIETALSVLNGRRKLVGDETVSISRVPDGYEVFQGMSPYHQVVAYVLGVEAQLDRDLGAITDNVFDVRYESFCIDPERLRQEILEWYLARQAMPVAVRRAILPVAIRAPASQSADTNDLTADRKSVV